MKPILVERLPADPAEWIYEIKFDGFRVIALKSGDSVELFSASHKPLGFPGIAEAIARLPCADAIIDGEIVALDEFGRSSFQLLQNAGDRLSQAPICLYAFDLLQLDGENLRDMDTVNRKERLLALLAASTPDHSIRFSSNLAGDPEHILAATRQMGLEGIVAKLRSARYAPGIRSPCWQKLKLVSEQEFVIGGYTAPEGSRKYFGSVIVGYYQDGKLLFASKAGSGFSTAALQSFHKMFQPLRRASCPFANLPEKRAGRLGQGLTAAGMRSCTWLEPLLVCQIRFAEWTADGGLRQPVFLGMREDKDPRQVVREKAATSSEKNVS